MSLIKLQGNASGTGAFTIAAPNGNTDRTLTLPDRAGTLIPGTIDGSGNVAFAGGIFLGGSGSANLLDDYEEGTWTPQVQGAGTAGTYTVSISTARYTKIGNQVTLWAYFGFSAASGGTGYAQIRNIPFAYDTGLGIAGTVFTANFDFSTANPATVAISGSFSASNTVMNLIEVRDAAGGIDAPVSGISTSTLIGFTVTYTAT